MADRIAVVEKAHHDHVSCACWTIRHHRQLEVGDSMKKNRFDSVQLYWPVFILVLIIVLVIYWYSCQYSNLLIMVDLNYSKINWDTLNCDSTIVLTWEMYYLTVMCINMLRQDKTKNILDLVICLNENTVNDVEILKHLGNSDHNIIVWKSICDVGLNTDNKQVENSTRQITFQWEIDLIALIGLRNVMI